MRGDPILNDFSAGELTSQLRRRENAEIYQKGVQSTQNVICLLHGGLFRRLGSKHISTAIDQAVKPRTIEFTTATDSYVIEFTDAGARLFDTDGAALALSAGAPPYSATEIHEIQYAQDENMMVFFHESHPVQTLVEVAGVFTWSEAMVSLSAQTISNPAAPSEESAWTLEMVGTWQEGDTFQLRLAGQLTGKIYYNTSTGVMVSRITDAINDTLRDPEGFINGTVGVSYSGTSEIYDIAFYNEFGDIVQSDFLTDAVTSAGGGTLALNNPNTYAGGGYDPEYPWSATNGYPKTGTFWDQRLVVGGTASQPATFWASRIGSPFDFITGTNAADPVQFDLKSERRCDIRTITATERLTFGTSSGDFVLEGILAPDVRFEVARYTSYPAKPYNTIELAGRVAYITSDGLKLRILEFSDELQKWTAHDATFRAEDITGGGITDMCLAANPNQVAFAVREDGGLLAFSFDTDQNVVAWSKLQTNGEVGSVCAKRKDGTDEIWMSVKRGDNWQIERIPTVHSDYFGEIHGTTGYTNGRLRATDACIDSFVEAVSTDTVTGLGHLEGMTVKALGDGAYLGEYVVASGAITVSATYDALCAGLGYWSRVTTLPLSIGNQLGTAQTTKRRWLKCFLELSHSVLPLVNGRREFTETEAQVMGGEPELLTGTYEVTPSHTDDEGRVTIEMDEPYPMHITALFGRPTLETREHQSTLHITHPLDYEDLSAFEPDANQDALRDIMDQQLDLGDSFTLVVDGKVVAIYGLVPDALQDDDCLCVFALIHQKRGKRYAYRVMKKLRMLIDAAKEGSVSALIQESNTRAQRWAQTWGAEHIANGRLPQIDDNEYQVWKWTYDVRT